VGEWESSDEEEGGAAAAAVAATADAAGLGDAGEELGDDVDELFSGMKLA